MALLKYFSIPLDVSLNRPKEDKEKKRNRDRKRYLRRKTDPVKGELFKQKRRDQKKQAMIEMKDYYLTQLINQSLDVRIPNEEIPKELINLKRKQLCLHRELKQRALQELQK